MSRRATALAGAVAGAVTGGVLLLLTHPGAEHTNDAYREGLRFGFVLRYLTLGLVGALLARAVARRSRTALAGIALAGVVAAAVLPVALDRESESERRRAAATAIDDPIERRKADFRAGAIDGCVEGTKRQLEGVAEAKRLDVDAYCTCFIESVIRGPGDDQEQLQAANESARLGRPPRRLTRIAERCAARAQRGG